VILAPAAAWSQPALKYNASRGAVTEISGQVTNPGVTWYDPERGYFNPCPLPTLMYGQHLTALPPRQTGGDGVGKTMDTNPLNSGGRTQTSYAAADSRGTARAMASSDVSSPCVVTPYDAYYMGSYGVSVAQFYRAFTVISDPTRAVIDLDWSMRGSFSSVTPAGGGTAYVTIYFMTDRPQYPAAGVPVAVGFLGLATFVLDSLSYSGTSVASCWPKNCPLPPHPTNVTASATVDLRAAFEASTGRKLTIGDSFMVGVHVAVSSVTCPGNCYGPLLPAFTTDFDVTAVVRSEVLGSR
jgi:hypothetical protein